MAERTDTESKLELTVAQDTTPAVAATTELVEAQKRVADALTTIAEALTPARLSDTLTGFAKAQAVGQIASAMVAAASKNGLDSRNWQRIETETAHLLGNVFDKVMQHLTAKAKGEVDPELKDAETGYKQWLEGNDPGDETDGK
jgi:hypothetical protein